VWRREHAIADAVQRPVPGSDKSPPPVAVKGWNSNQETLMASQLLFS